MPSFSTCLTHFISKYFAKKRGNLLIKGKPSYLLCAQLNLFFTIQILSAMVELKWIILNLILVTHLQIK